MFAILFWPFKMLFALIGWIFEFVFGIIGAVFGLVGGLLGFLFSGAVFFLVVLGVMALVRWFGRGYRNP